MRAIFLLFLFTSCIIFAEEPSAPPDTKADTSDISLTAEGLPSTFVNHVNTVFGNLLFSSVDMTVPGPVPLPLVRYYNSETTNSKWLHGFGMSTNYPLWIRGSCPNSMVHCGIGYASFIEGQEEEAIEQTRFPGIDEDEDDYDETEDEDDDDAVSPAFSAGKHHRHHHGKQHHREELPYEGEHFIREDPFSQAEEARKRTEDERREKEALLRKLEQEKEPRRQKEATSTARKEAQEEAEAKRAQKKAAKEAASKQRREENIKSDNDEKEKHHHDVGEEHNFAFAYMEEDGGSVISASGEPHEHNMDFYLDPKTIHQGLTNVGSGEISARTNLKNVYINYHQKPGKKGFKHDHKWHVTLSNGTEREYRKGQEFHKDKVLREEIQPSGNKLKFECGKQKNWGVPLKKITAECGGKATGHLSVEYYKEDETQKKVAVHGSNGKYTYYYFERHDIDGEHVPFITKVRSSDQPYTEYEYDRYHHNEKRLMSKIIHPEGRYLKIDYDEKGRVKRQRGPVGPNGAEATIFEFKYHPGSYHTDVIDANGYKSEYHYSSKKRLKTIVHFDKNENILREDKFFWGEKDGLKRGSKDSSDEGNLIAKALIDDDGAISCTRYSYDDCGNIVGEKFYGNLTGTFKTHFSIDQNGHPKGHLEEYIRIAHYNNDKFHMCNERKEDCGPTLTFSYKDETNLIERKLTLNGSQITSREFYWYDDAGILIKKISDDGSTEDPHNRTDVTERHITYVTPVRGGEAFGVGQPQEIREYYLQNSQEVLLKKVTFEYTQQGQISKETFFDANNSERYHIDYEYDRKGHLIHSVNSAGKECRYGYDQNGNKIREELVGSGVYSEFFFDTVNRLTQAVEHHADGLCFTTSYTYDNGGNKTSMTDRYGQVTHYEYDGLGRVKKVLHPEMVNQDETVISPIEEVDEYTVQNLAASSIDARELATKKKYTARGQPTVISYPDGSSERFVYNLNGTLSRKIDRHGVETCFSYDIFGRVLESTVAGIKTSSHTYSSFHETSSTDPMGVTTFFTYDGAGRIIQEEKNGQKIQFSYDELGRKASEKSFEEGGSYVETVYIYDLLNRVIEQKTQHSDGTLLSKVQYAYDMLDNRIEVTTFVSETVSHTEKTEYNSLKLPTKHTDCLGYVTYFHYDFGWKNELGQSVLKKTTTDPLGNQSVQILDAFGRVDTAERRSPKGDLLAKTVFRYDAKGNKTLERQFVYSNGEFLREYIIQWTYTAADLIATCIEQPSTPEQKKTEYLYTRGGLLETIVKPDGVEIHHTYDLLARLSTITSSDGSINYSYEYDLNDNVTSVHDNKLNLMHTKAYDASNRVTCDAIGTGVTSLFSYDISNRVTRFSLLSGEAVEYRYKSGGLQDVVRKDSSNHELYTHRYEDFDLRGNVTRSSLINSCGTLQNTWDPLSRLEKIFSQHFEENCAKFDGAGNLLEIVETDPQGKKIYSFAYDDLYQLTEEKSIADICYKNDSINNRLKKNEYDYTLNGLNQLLSEGDKHYTYDKNGNPIQIDDCLLSYDALDRLIAFERPNDIRAEYAYDPFHRRIQKTIFSWNGTSWENPKTQRFIFFNNREIGSMDNSGAIHEFRILGLGRGAEIAASIAIELDGKTYCPIHDHRGNIAVLLDATTKLPVDTYRYSAFGEEELFSSTSNPWRFASKRTDPESGFVFFGRRYYSPQAGRFMTPDPTGFSDGPNLYSYVHNSPLMFVDPYGLSILDAIARSSSAYYNSDELRHVSYNPTGEDPSRKVDTVIYPNGTQYHSENIVGNTSDIVLKEPHVEWLKSGEKFYDKFANQDLKGYLARSWNGMCNTYEEAKANAATIQSASGDYKDVLVCHNPSEGPLIDLIECALQKMHITTYVDRQICDQLIGVQAKCQASGIKVDFCDHMHSQGALTGRNVLSDSRLQKGSETATSSIKIITYGAPTHPPGSTNYAAKGDLVPLFALYPQVMFDCFTNPSPLNALSVAEALSRDHVTMCGEGSSPGEAHSFQGPSYQEALKDAVKSEGGN